MFLVEQPLSKTISLCHFIRSSLFTCSMLFTFQLLAILCFIIKIQDRAPHFLLFSLEDWKTRKSAIAVRISFNKCVLACDVFGILHLREDNYNNITLTADLLIQLLLKTIWTLSLYVVRERVYTEPWEQPFNSSHIFC